MSVKGFSKKHKITRVQIYSKILKEMTREFENKLFYLNESAINFFAIDVSLITFFFFFLNSFSRNFFLSKKSRDFMINLNFESWLRKNSYIN